MERIDGGGGIIVCKWDGDLRGEREGGGGGEKRGGRKGKFGFGRLP